MITKGEGGEGETGKLGNWETGIDIYALCCASLLSCVRLFVTPWTAACQAPLSVGILQARILRRVAMTFSNIHSTIYKIDN